MHATRGLTISCDSPFCCSVETTWSNVPAGAETVSSNVQQNFNNSAPLLLGKFFFSESLSKKWNIQCSKTYFWIPICFKLAYEPPSSFAPRYRLFIYELWMCWIFYGREHFVNQKESERLTTGWGEKSDFTTKEMKSHRHQTNTNTSCKQEKKI